MSRAPSVAIQRGGEVRLKVERRNKASKKMLHWFVLENTAEATQHLMTDENPGYVGIHDANTTHQAVNHRLEEGYAVTFTPTPWRALWSLFERSIVGYYHQVGANIFSRTLDEFEWRFNQRDNPHLFRDTLMRLLNSPKMEFKELIEKSA
jgi:hypothetical protein